MTTSTGMLKGMNARGLAKTAALGFSALMLLPAMCAPASAGFFEALFGPRQQSIPVYAPASQLPLRLAPAQKAQPRALTIRPSLSVVKASAPIRKVSIIAPVKVAAVRPAVLAGPLGPFLLDPTLRRGDVVVTNEGLKVFTGPAKSQHGSSEFTALSHSAQFASGNTSVLEAIERANRFSSQPLVQAAPSTSAPIAKNDKQASLEVR
jgi:hypothetical protein